MKKWFLGIIILVFFFLSPLFHSGVPVSHDGESQIARFAAYYQAFQDGNFPPRWAGNLNFGYGVPVFIFYYPLSGYLAGILHLLGFSFEAGFKLLLGASFIASFFTFFLWARIIFNKNTAILGGFLYGLLPYHFLNLYIRGDIGEMIAYALAPLVFWSIEKVIKTTKLLFIVLGGIFYGLFILSHNGVSLMFSPVFVLYAIVRTTSKTVLLRIAVMLILGLMISAFFWIPALYEGKYVNAHLFIGSMYKDNFPTVSQLIFSKWGFGPDVNKPGGLSPQIGIIYIFFVIVGVIIWFKTKKQKRLLGMWIAVFLLALFIVLPQSSILWKNLSLLRLYEFPWRFVGLASFAAVVLACFVISRIKNTKYLIVIGIIILFASSQLVRVDGFVAKNDRYYSSFTGTTYYHGEASPIWTAGDKGEFAKQQIEIIGGEGKVTDIKKKNQQHTFSVEVTRSPFTILDNTVYFPGWQVMIDGKKIPIQFQDPNNRGLITFQVPEGKHEVNIIFTETIIRKLANLISLIAVFLILILFVSNLLYNKNTKHI